MVMPHPPVNRKARAAATVAFATNGALPASLLARYAEVQEILGLDAGTFGLVIAGFMVGAACAFQIPALILRRLGSGRTTSFGTFGFAVMLVVGCVGVGVGKPWLFLVGLLVAGFLDAVVDVAQNSQGLQVQEQYGRSVLTSMHAGWSIGAATGGVVGILAAIAGVSLVLHMTLWGLLCSAVVFIASRWFIPTQQVEEDSAGKVGKSAILLLIPLVLVALAGISVEDIGSNWSAILLATERGVPVAAAGIGLSVLLGAQFIGRLLGDRFIDTVGSRAAVISALVTLTTGLLIAAWAPTMALTLVGLAMAGLGCAITVPLAFSGADAIPGLKAHAGVAWINWMMRAATVALTPMIGGITNIAGLPVAITVIAMIGVTALGYQFLWRPTHHAR